MDRIETGSEVHSPSIHKYLKTRTLYEMVTAWVEQSWDGVQYKRITEELWNSIDASNLMEGLYGVSVTLLESCIVDSTEALQAGQLTEEQAVDGLKKLLENDDFVEGARTIEVCVNTNPVCRISNIDHMIHQSQSREPLRWTLRMKIGFVVSLVTTLGVYIVMIGLQLWEPIGSLSWLVITSVSWILLYYFIKRQSPTFYKVMWPLGHACIFAMGYFILFIPLGPIISSVFSPSPDISYRFFDVLVFWIGLGCCMVIGGILGDRLGKKRNYMPYML
ncbi:MAG: hypothetical protein ACTSSE_18175 [Candidatus Thorarchaeota archaeon]